MSRLSVAVLQTLPIFYTTPAIVLSPLKHERRFWPIKHKKSKDPNGIIGSEDQRRIDIQMNMWAVESQLQDLARNARQTTRSLKDFLIDTRNKK